MRIKLLSGFSLRIPEGVFTSSALGASLRPAITQRGSGCWLDAREKMPHLTGSIAGGEPAGGFWFRVRLSHTPGRLPLYR